MSYFLKQIDKNNFVFDGNREITFRNLESVLVDGEQYSRYVFEDKIMTAEDFYNSDSLWGGKTELKYNFEEIDYQIEVKNVRGNPFKNRLGFNLSSNHYVEVLQLMKMQSSEYDLYKLNKINLDDRIKSIYTGKTRQDSRYFGKNTVDYIEKYESKGLGWIYKDLRNTEFIKDFIERGIVEFQMFNYGFNNSVYYTISAVDYCQLPYERIKGKGLEILQRLGWYGKRENELKNAMRIFEEKIKNPDLC